MLAIFIYLNGDNMKIGIITRTSIIDDKKFSLCITKEVHLIIGMYFSFISLKNTVKISRTDSIVLS